MDLLPREECKRLQDQLWEDSTERHQFRDVATNNLSKRGEFLAAQVAKRDKLACFCENKKRKQDKED